MMLRTIADWWKKIKTPCWILVGLTGACVPGCAKAEKPDLPPHPRMYLCSKAQERLLIDGRLDEQAWRDAPWTEEFVDIEGTLKPLPRLRTRAKMVWDDSCFYIGAELEEPHVWAMLTRRDTVIFYDNDFEVFIDPNGDSHEYYEFEMNALNTVWDLFLPKPYRDGGPAVDAWTIHGLATAVHVRGSINDAADIDTGWTVEIAMPWSALGEYAHQPVPPREGNRWRVNFSRVEWLHEIVDGTYRKVAGKREDNWVWSPQWVIDMHRPETWGYVEFREDAGAAVPLSQDRAWEAKMLLYRVYYVQKEFHEREKRWGTTNEELGMDSPSVSSQGERLELRGDGGSFTASIRVSMPEGEVRTWHIRQDSRLWSE